MNTRVVLASVVALSVSGVFACTGLAASLLTIADTPFGKFEVNVPEFAARDFSVAAYGAKEGVKSTEAFARAMAECERLGGGRVVVPPGKWLTGAVHFRNNCNLHLAEGATLEFTDDPDDYPEVFTTWEGIECYNYSPLIYAFGVTNVAITGKGLIAPRMDFWRTWFDRPPEHMKATEHLYYWCSTNAPVSSRRLLALDRAHMRPHLMQFNRCGNVLLDGFKIRDSPFWMIHLYHSEDCVVRNLDTYARGYNNDGVDIDMTKNVLVENCRFDQGDDGIVLKAGRNADAWRIGRCTENVVVRDCDLVNSHSLLGIGSELSGGVRNVWMTRCKVMDTFSMLRIKTGPRRGGFVENVWIDHCRGERMIRVFNIFTAYCAQWGQFPDFELRRTKIRNINMSDCEAALAAVGLELVGDRLQPPVGIRVRNVRIGRVVRAFTDVRDCLDVKLDGVALAPEGAIPVSAKAKPRLFFAGDSTLDDNGLSLGGAPKAPYASWGTTLRKYLADGCEVRNYAVSGASTKSFIKSGQWSKLLKDAKPGDYVVIQFGHNDQKRSSEFYLNERWADPNGAFRNNVRAMVKEARWKGVAPILLSPICRGTFDKDGKGLVDTTHASDGVCLGSYRDAMKELAAELDCDYVDMNGLTRELMERVALITPDPAVPMTVAKDDGSASSAAENETAKWQAEIDRASASGGGVVSVPAGVHRVGGLELRSNVELRLEKGAVLEALYGLENYRVVKLPYSEGDWSAIVMGLNVTNAAVTGDGTIDGRGALWPPTPKGFKGCHEGLRPRGLFFAYSKDIRLEGYTLRNTACWGQVFKNCDGVTASGITVFNHGNQNNDGFDIEARNVLIENCVLDTNDDQFCIKSNDPGFTVENVTIRNCVARGQASAFKIGTATRGVVRHVRVENLRCEPTRGIFSRYADGTPAKYLYHLGVYHHPETYPYGFGLIGIAVECVDGGCVEDVVVDGVTFVDGFKIPIFVRADRRAHHHADDGLKRGGHNVLRDVVIRNVKGYVIGPMASSITGTKDFRVQNVLLENIDIVQPGAGEVAGRLAAEDPAPYRENCYPSPDIYFPSILPAYGLYVDYADGVELKNVRFRTLAEGPVELRPEIVRTGR